MPYLTDLDTQTQVRQMADLDVEDVLSRLTLKEKVMLTAGKLVIVGSRVLTDLESR